ncbi:YaaR family protein [Thermosipho ferrireducens]|uniref:YaaR family protein n=1 Tax=Thermosipho ferrireducens TaxID=2571116 RepID=A0ABX7S882_9BACT|nr:YaaR family protein [Thermosipho ferrireducens]QTA38414.1 YaaR family protein [Thermosipho ferrireducens]
MRIEPPGDPKIKSGAIKKKKTSKKKKVSFEGEVKGFFDVLMDVEEEVINKEIERVVQEILDAGNDFVRSPTPDSLKKYKEKIKEFLKLIEKKLYKLGGKMDYSTNSPRLHIIVEKVDQKLKDLADKLMTAESGTINFAARVEEINGLILDLYK